MSIGTKHPVHLNPPPRSLNSRQRQQQLDHHLRIWAIVAEGLERFKFESIQPMTDAKFFFRFQVHPLSAL